MKGENKGFWGKRKTQTLQMIYKGEGGEQKVRIVLRGKIKCMTEKFKCEGRNKGLR